MSPISERKNGMHALNACVITLAYLSKRILALPSSGDLCKGQQHQGLVGLVLFDHECFELQRSLVTPPSYCNFLSVTNKSTNIDVPSWAKEKGRTTANTVMSTCTKKVIGIVCDFRKVCAPSWADDGLTRISSAPVRFFVREQVATPWKFKLEIAPPLFESFANHPLLSSDLF